MFKSHPLISVAAVVELLTGLTLLLVPRLFIALLLGVDADTSAVVIARVCGVALLSLGLACWPSNSSSTGQLPVAVFRALLTYNASLTAYLIYLFAAQSFRAPLLIPAILLHAILTLLLLKSHFLRPAPR